jgi:hypothetical protein
MEETTGVPDVLEKTVLTWIVKKLVLINWARLV